METHNPPQNQQAARELPPALPKGLTPAEARAQAGDVETLIVKLTPPQMASARVETGSLDLGFVRLVVSVSGATPPAPEMRVLRADGSEIAAYGPAGKVAALRGEPAAWEFFFINDPMASGGEAALEFVTR